MRLVCLLVLALGASASAQTYTGRLEPQDGTLNSGELRDEYTVDARRGETVRAVVTSQAFDTYVIVKSETGAQAEDDDCTDGETTRSCAALVADVDGPVRVLVTSFRPGETGDYRVQIAVGDAAEPAAGDATTGALGEGDLALASGEYADRHAVAVRAGQRLAVRLASESFEPYLIVRGPAGEQAEAVSCDGAEGQACLSVEADADGVWEVFATSTGPAQSGRYALDIAVDGSPDAARTP